MRHNSYLFIIQIINYFFLYIITWSAVIRVSSGKSIEDLREELEIKHNPLSRILDGSGLTTLERFNCVEEWPNFTLKNILICYCKDKHSVVSIYNDGKNQVSPEWEIINQKVINSQQDMISQLYLINCSYNIGPKAIKSLSLDNLNELIIAGSGHLKLESNSLVFSNRNVKVSIFHVQKPFSLPVIPSSVSSLSLD